MSKFKKQKRVSDVVAGEVKNSLLSRTMPKSKKAWVVILSLLFVVFLIVLTAVGVWQFRGQKPGVVLACSGKGDRYAADAAVVLRAVDRDKLKTVNDAIQKLPDYDKDPNCLYPIVRYYTIMSDAKNSQEWFNKLQTAYDPQKGRGLSPRYEEYANNLDAVKKQVDEVVKANEQIKSNSRVF